MKILGIETSCDETAASVVAMDESLDNKTNKKLEILSNVIASQIDLHKQYGGVYPEVASRAHSENIIPVLEEALDVAGSNRNLDGIDAIAVTTGPGLIGSLMVGVTAAKTLAFDLKVPIVPINHWEGHIYSVWFEEPLPQFPALFLTVSGGHTNLILMKDHGKYKILGQTLDDAAGEAFDKAAKLLGLGYPGGPAISAEAEKLKDQNEKIKNTVKNEKYKLPIPMITDKSFNFSFSGLKTALLYKVRDLEKSGKKMEDYRSVLAYKFQESVVESLLHKFKLAALEYRPKSVCLTGGVSANKTLRERFREVGEGFDWKPSVHIPEQKLSTDNAVMVAGAGAFRFLANGAKNCYDVNVDSGAKLCRTYTIE